MNEDESMKQLYPNLNAEERAAAVEVLHEYLLLAWEIWEESEQAKSTKNEQIL